MGTDQAGQSASVPAHEQSSNPARAGKPVSRPARPALSRRGAKGMSHVPEPRLHHGHLVRRAVRIDFVRPSGPRPVFPSERVAHGDERGTEDGNQPNSPTTQSTARVSRSHARSLLLGGRAIDVLRAFRQTGVLRN